MKDKLFAEEINDVIKAVVEEYAALLYIWEQLSKIPKCDIQLFLDVLLMKIRSKTISYAAMKKRLDERKEKDLENCIQSLEAKIVLNENEKRKLEKDKQELVAIRDKKMEGVLLRLRARWIVDSEKITKYFCGLEKRNYISKQMTKLTLNNGEEIYESKDIIKEVKVFYERLYSERQVEDCEILDMAQDIPIPRLPVARPTCQVYCPRTQAVHQRGPDQDESRGGSQGQTAETRRQA